MSLTEEERERHCQKIIQQRRIKGCIVVLCEGDANYINIHTPQQMRQLDKFPDANFWRAAIPVWWRTKIPVFIPCGDRNSVLLTYKRLLELHNNEAENSYLSTHKLFALIDLDLQPLNLSSYTNVCNNAEALYYATYKNGQLDEDTIIKSRIIITGLIHKEAYFIEPDLQELFDKSEYELELNGAKLSLENLYHEMLDSISSDKDLAQNFETAIQRIEKHLNSKPNDCSQLANLLRTLFSSSSTNPSNKRNIILALLKIIKAKPFWHQIAITHPYQQSDSDALKDSLILEIGKFYANCCPQEKQARSHKYHIPQWVSILNDYNAQTH